MSFLKTYTFNFNNQIVTLFNADLRDFDNELIYFGRLGQGETTHSGIIKTGSRGEVIWSKSFPLYWISDSIRLANGDFLVSAIIAKGSESEPYGRLTIFRISSLGDLIWSKELDPAGFGLISRINRKLLLVLDQNTFFFIGGPNKIFKFNGTGELISQIDFGSILTTVEYAKIDGNNIVLIGRSYFKNNEILSLHSIVKLDFDLSILIKKRFEISLNDISAGASASGIYGFEIINDYYYIVADFIVAGSRETIWYKIPSDLTSIFQLNCRTANLANLNQYTFFFDGGIVISDSIGKKLRIVGLEFNDYREVTLFSFNGSQPQRYSSLALGDSFIYLTSSGESIGQLTSIPRNLDLQKACLDGQVTSSSNLPYTDLTMSLGDNTYNIGSINAIVTNYSLASSNLIYYENVQCVQMPPTVIRQSPHLYLQSAGSTGSDGSASGIYLRWLLKKDLINHIPKGNLASTTVNYNKPNDFVTLYRATYVPEITTIDFSQPPQAVENRNALWIYQVNNYVFYLYFRNRTKYSTVRSSFDPITQPMQFIQNYGSDLLEFQTSSDLFFAIQFTTSSTSTAAKVESEILSVEGSTEIQEKQITARKAFIGSELSNARLITENGKSLRFRPTNCHVTSISIELYSVFSDAIEDGPGWSEIGQFALSETDNEVFERLEPTLDIVNATWPRYNDGALVKIQNYKDKWNQPSPSTQSTIKQTVQDYVSLSDNEDNPLALETFSFDTTPPPGANPEDNTFEIPNLVLLQQAAMDYHVARMLGMGHLDVSAGVQNNDSFVYMLKYDTLVTLEDGQLIPETTEHRFMTPPTTRNDQKLPTPVDLKVPVPGVFLQGGVGESPESLTDENGYTLDGKSRYITLYADEIEDLSRDLGFYNVTTEFNLALETTPVYAGIEYKKTGDPDWRRPELPNTPDYQNLAPSGQTPYNETVPLPIPDEGTALFVHRETESGEHIYGSYGVNWFSRITRSVQEHALTTTILPTNTLLPPTDRSALLIVEEQPLMLTTANEQVLRSSISGSDKTLIRLMFNYNSDVELQSYRISDPSINPQDPNSIFPDSEEVFADEVELFFRNSMPSNVSGKATNVADHPTNEILSVITTSSYTLASTEETITPTISLGSETNFIGGVLVLEEVEFIIHEVDTTNPNAPTFTVYKKQISDKLQNNNQPNAEEELEAPVIKTDGLFLAVENLQNTGSWGTPNPHPLKVQIGDNWPIHREVITRFDPDGNAEEYLQKTRGIWDNATIEKILQAETPGGTPTVHKGQYKATFGSAILANHPQSGGANPVQWYKGIMRVHTINTPNGERKNLEVFKIENIGTSNALIVYFTDRSFGASNNEEIQTGGAIQVNFYPGYRIYLYANAAAGITENSILPQSGEGIKYSCFGFRSINNSNSYYSRIAIPTVMFAQEVIAPLVPQLPIGSLYATRPDSFGKATYSITTQFSHIPHGILYYRSDDDAILNALYIPGTTTNIKQELEGLDPSFLANRWQNLLGFDYNYPTNSFQTDGLFGVYPETAEGYRLPNPDNPNLFGPTETPGALTPGEMVGKIKDAVLESFVPLTEVPLLYEYINGGVYDPVPKKQVIRDRNGNVLKPTDTGFDIAPMAKKIGTNQVRFVDFTLDGTSNNLYFYSAKELSNTLQMSDFSPILGPIKLVNTNPPVKPGIRQVVPILENNILGIPSQIEISINAYPMVENIKSIALYRSLNQTNALSIRSMELVKEIDLEVLDVLNENIWTISDDFGDLIEIPYGDPLYYRVIVQREIEYPDKNDENIILNELVPSESSKLLVTTIVETSIPEAPSLSFTANTGVDELTNVVLQWDKTVYKGTYYIYKMNEQGQWSKIHEVVSNDETVNIPLENTALGVDFLLVMDVANNSQNIYHHFKVVVENTSGLLSNQERILTIP